MENCATLHQKAANLYIINPSQKEDNLLKGSFSKNFDGEKFGFASGPDKQLLSRASS